MLKTRLHLAVLTVFLAASAVHAATPASQKNVPVKPDLSGFTAVDMPYDKGEAVLLTWPAGPGDLPEASFTVSASGTDGKWIKIAEFAGDKKLAADMDLPFWAWDHAAGMHALQVYLPEIFEDFEKGREYSFKLNYTNGKVRVESPPEISPEL